MAAPSYLQQHGLPETLEDLQHHNCIRLLTPSTGQPMKWMYRSGQKVIKLPLQGSHMVTGAETARILAIQGIGITHLVEFVVSRDIGSGDLQPLLEPIESPVRQAFALYKQRQPVALKVQLFLDFLTQLQYQK